MVKVFFADAGDRDQLLVTLRRIEEESLARVADLRDLAGRPTNFPHRRHLQALALQAMLGEEEQVLTWAAVGAGAGRAVDRPRPTPGAWDPHAEIAAVAARASELLRARGGPAGSRRADVRRGGRDGRPRGSRAGRRTDATAPDAD